LQSAADLGKDVTDEVSKRFEEATQVHQQIRLKIAGLAEFVMTV
jgi:hypothetical protein